MKKLLILAAMMIVSAPALAEPVTKGAVQRLNLDSIKLDGTTVTATGAELNYNDVTTAGTVEASKSVVVDANKDASGFRNITGEAVILTSAVNTSGIVFTSNMYRNPAVQFTKKAVALASVNAGEVVIDALSGRQICLAGGSVMADGTLLTATNLVLTETGGTAIATIPIARLQSEITIPLSSTAVTLSSIYSRCLYAGNGVKVSKTGGTAAGGSNVFVNLLYTIQ